MVTLHHRLRLARRIEACWRRNEESSLNNIPGDLGSLENELRSIQLVARRLDYARARGWNCVRADLTAAYSSQMESLGHLSKRLTKRIAEPVAAKRPDWLGEFTQLDDEFGEIQVHWDRRCFSVATDPITLEGVELGPFAIEFFWDRLERQMSSCCFDLVALEPNPASCNEDTTHPHIRDREICPGDAASPIEDALRDGRLADAFLLIRSVISHYNAGSAYVSLDRWSGTACHDCGTIEDPEQVSYCEGCDGDFCEDCFGYCAACERSRCSECLSRCDVCRAARCPGCLEASASSGRDCCTDCLVACTECEELYASDELDSETQICTDCSNATDESHLDPTSTPTTEDQHESIPIAIPAAPTPTDPDVCAHPVAETAVFSACG